MSTSTSRDLNSTPETGPRVFATTRWSVVLAARDTNPAAAVPALEQLCRTYWYPLYAQARRSGSSPADAEDLTQGFFARLLARDGFALADQNRGRFRSFLSAAFQHFLANERDRVRARKRGGHLQILSLDVAPAEERFLQEPATPCTAEQDFDRRWALALLEVVFGRLRQEYVDAGKGGLFQQIQGAVAGDDGDASGVARAEALGMSEGAVRVATHRLRRRYRELLREEIAHTVEGPDAVDEELRHLFAAFSQ
ncbi:MAG: sigma-70 family RNA polymerase sigma factor [Verrucomicrobiales bacterium]|nr:sigma-70 family RNA polymerase sigma factor [Verrucomicrobiales bacterium]